MKKLIFPGLVFVIGIMLLPKPVKAAGATLSLSPATQGVAVGANFMTNLALDTGGQAVSSVSAVLTYDPTLLAVTISPGTILSLSQMKVANGVITIATDQLPTNYNGSGTLATLNFRALAAGTAQVTIVFTGAALGSSVVLGSNGVTNILDLVNNGVYTLGAGGAETTATTTTTTTATTGGTPVTGTVGETLIFVTGGLLLFAAGGFFLRKVYVA